MNSQPLLSIDKFSGMSDDGGTFYIDGFSVVKDNGLTSLDETFNVYETYTSSTTNYTNLGAIMAILTLQKLPNSTLNESIYNLSFDGVNFHISGKDNNLTYSGYVGLSGELSSQKPDMISLPSGNIIYTNSRYLGLIVRGQVRAGSSTTTIIDKAGRNFESSFGIANGDKVCNIKTGKLYTITSITNENYTKDKLTFTAIDGSANTTDDEFMIFNGNFRDLNYIDGISGALSPTFFGQQTQQSWSRPIRQFGVGDLTKYLILNGNNIGLLSNDESTADFGFKHLPSGYQGLAMDINSGYILVSAFDSNGRGHLLYWDGFSDGWNNDINLDKAPAAVKNYIDGWVYLSDGEIFYTNGTQLQSLIKHPDKKFLNSNIECKSHNSIAILNDKIYFAVGNGRQNRLYQGILVFDKNNGLYWFKNKIDDSGFATPNCVYNVNYLVISSTYEASNAILIGCDYALNEILDFDYQSSTSTSDCKSFVIELDFKQATQVSQIWLNLKHTSKYYSRAKNRVCDITISTGNGKNGIISFGQVGTITSVDTIPNPLGEIYPGKVGDEIEITSGILAGQRTFITATNGNGNNEVWTVSPSLSSTSLGSSNIRTWRLNKGEQKTISINDVDEPVIFNCNFFGAKMYLEIVVRGNANSFPCSINDIQLF